MPLQNLSSRTKHRVVKAGKGIFQLGALPIVMSIATQSNFAFSEEQRNRIEEVVVTAQKRTENIRDVPISITVMSEEFIKDSSITDVNELSQYVPNVVINASAATGFVAMRGLGSGYNKGFERSVAVVIDGIYYGRQDYLYEALADVERLEVLRGPQGTLFGKNAIAGALNITTGIPTDEFSGSLNYLGGDLDRSKYDVAIAGPLLPDVLLARLSLSLDQHNGFIHNTAADLDSQEYPDSDGAYKELGAKDDKIARLKLFFPELITNLDLTLTATKVSTYSNSGAMQLTAATPEALDYYRRYDPMAEADPTNEQGSSNSPTPTGREGSSFSLQADYQLGEFTLTGIGGHSYFDRYDSFDGDQGAADAIYQSNEDSYSQSSAEFRLTSPPGTFEYVAGLYYFESSLEGAGNMETSLTEFLEMFAASNIGLNTNIESLLGLPSGTLPSQGIALETPRIFNQESKAGAVFGQATWNITDRLALIAGLRYSEEEKSVDTSLEFNDRLGNVIATAVGFAILNSTAYDETREREETDFSPKFSARYDLTDEITVYATYARAFKAGGFNEQAASADNLEFEPEKAQTWEAGAKMRFADGLATLNVGFFHTSFDNLQVSMYDGLNFSVGNAASAISQGVEIEGRVIPSNWLDLQFSLGLLDAYYDSYPDAPCTATSGEDACDLTGETLVRAPKVEFSFGPRMNLSKIIPGLDKLPVNIGAGVDALYRSEQYFSTDLDPIDYQPATTEVSAQIRLSALDDSWWFSFSARNITDEHIIAHSQDVPLLSGTHFGVVNPGARYFTEFRYVW